MGQAEGVRVSMADGCVPAPAPTWAGLPLDGVTRVADVDRAALSAAPAPPPEYPAVAGRPHPRSAAERELEAVLARCAWATGRTWNQVHHPHPLDVPIRVDLMWPDARCVVEIDGPDHRGALKYADDRRRDNALVLAGYAVLRFTNDDIHRDTATVLATMRRLLTDRRQKGTAT